MTGFGEARIEHADQAYTIELRSVNNRYFKASIHLPDDFGFLEGQVERYLRERVTRGSVTVRMYVRGLTAGTAPELNLAAIGQYITQLSSLLDAHPHLTIDAASLALVPDVAQPREMDPQVREQAWGVLEKLLAAATTRLLEMRQVEGRMVAEDLRTQCSVVRDQLQRVQARAPQVVTEYRDRLLNRVRQLLAGSGVELAQQDILKEVAIYADRSDVNEEISRLVGHLEQFEGCMTSREPAGRKLEFISQELMREANTMGSKTGDSEIARAVVEIKSAVDRIKEQVQNVE